MTGDDLKELLEACKAPYYAWLRKLIKEDARALWAVRVLDAAEERGWRFTWAGNTVKALLMTDPRGVHNGAAEGFTRDAARLVAALAVFPDLDAATRQRLGECP